MRHLFFFFQIFVNVSKNKIISRIIQDRNSNYIIVKPGYFGIFLYVAQILSNYFRNPQYKNMGSMEPPVGNFDLVALKSLLFLQETGIIQKESDLSHQQEIIYPGSSQKIGQMSRPSKHFTFYP